MRAKDMYVGRKVKLAIGNSEARNLFGDFGYIVLVEGTRA